jgi:rhodanese-related sulfurtransferase
MVRKHPEPIIRGVDDIKQKAKERGQKMKLPYAGALLPAEAHALMQEGAKLVDVRTDAELHYVGSVPASEAIEWNSIDGQRNAAFLRQLEQVAGKQEPVMFLCRSGARSHAAAAAAAQAGWKEAYNVLEGFEGDKDSQDHRNTVGGWRHARLPWVQS